MSPLEISSLCIIVQVYDQAKLSGKDGAGDFQRFVPVILVELPGFGERKIFSVCGFNDTGK